MPSWNDSLIYPISVSLVKKQVINESQVVIDVQRLSRSEKEQILYNHIKLGEQPRYFKTQIKPFLNEIASSSHFLPEIARRLGSPLFTKNLGFDTEALRAFVEKPLDFLVEVVTNLDNESGAALALVFMRGGMLESPVELTRKERSALEILGVQLSAARRALVALDGSLLSLIHSADQAIWRFKHPTIGDAYATIVGGNPELLDVYMSWTSAEKIITEVTCGDVGLEGVKVVVPQRRFQQFIDRLREIKPGRPLLTFLATRCCREFLAIYIARHGELANQICEPGSYLSAAAEVDLLVRLHELDLLPPAWRQRFMRRAKELLLETPDVDFLAVKRIRALFPPEEISALLQLIKDELIPTLPSLVEEWAANCDSDTDPGEWFSPLVEVVRVLSNEFKGDHHAAAALKEARTDISLAVDSLEEDRPVQEYDADYNYGGVSDRIGSDDKRSIFDDVDE